MAMSQFQLKLAREKRQAYEKLRKVREQEWLEHKHAVERETKRSTPRADNNRLCDVGRQFRPVIRLGLLSFVCLVLFLCGFATELAYACLYSCVN